MARFQAAWLEHQQKRFSRPDGGRYLRPDAVTTGAIRYVRPQYAYLARQTAARNDSAAQAEITSDEFAAYRYELLNLKMMVAELKWQFALRRFARKALHPPHHSEFQPRVPPGSREGGQWTREGGDVGEGHIRLAGDIPTNEPPEVPDKRPATVRERNSTARGLSRGLRLYGLMAVGEKALGWLKEHWPEIVADQDPPKTLQELQDAASSPKKGYHKHHIAEQGPAREDGFSEEMIESRENTVLIPQYQHERITGWFNTKSDRFNGMSPREHLRGKDWDERRRIGLEALESFGVLKQ